VGEPRVGGKAARTNQFFENDIAISSAPKTRRQSPTLRVSLN
jgi:hypothetical protein